jgi:hypothetical protein
VWLGLCVALLFWISVDLFLPSRHSIRQFDPQEVARLETAMWQSYYEKNPALLFWQLAGGLRQQFHAPFWRSFSLGFKATKAAFIFKRGHSRADYSKALPVLIDYYQAIQDLTIEKFDVARVARLELAWWIVHRQRNQYSYQALANALAQTAAALYNQSPEPFTTYAQLRTRAMQVCDRANGKPGGPTPADWQRIEQGLDQAWGNLHTLIQAK